MKLSDYIIEFLAKEGVKHIFGITGGAVLHLFDSIGKNKKISYICPQHEQAAAMAADAYSRISKNLGVAIATSGPGATNLITGVACSYFDSIPTIFITGQVSTFRLKENSPVRQIGFQETDIVKMFSPITKYSVLIKDKKMIRYELEKAVWIARNNRPGPVLLDIPDNIQREEINPEELISFTPSPKIINSIKIEKQVEECLKLIQKSKRPIVILGAGVKLGYAQEKTKKIIEQLKIPFVLTWATLDLFLYNHPLNAGGFGITSPRCGNFTVQNSDLILALGTRLDTHHTGTPINTFAREAKKIVVDIDLEELEKFDKYGMKVELMINEDINDFITFFSKKIKEITLPDFTTWIKKIEEWKKKYSFNLEELSKETEGIDSYVFLDFLSKKTEEGDIIITDAGGNLTQTFSGYQFRKNQTLFSAFNNSPMGYSLPASIGVCFANDKKKVICIIGDGGLQMNIQELATIAKHKLPIIIIVFNNKGYGMIKQSQDDWLNSNYEASSIEKGIAVPNFVKIADSYGLLTEKISNHQEIEEKLSRVLNTTEGILCEINISEKQQTIPMLKFGRPLEDSNPLLKRDEFLKNMIVKPLKQSLLEEN